MLITSVKKMGSNNAKLSMLIYSELQTGNNAKLSMLVNLFPMNCKQAGSYHLQNAIRS